MTNERKETVALLHFLIDPFVAFAGINFLPWWVSAPLCILLSVTFLGSMVILERSK